MQRFPELLRRRLTEVLPGPGAQFRMAPSPQLGPSDADNPASLRPAAALVLIYPHHEAWHVPVTVRGAGLRHHTSQVSLPGGRIDQGESAEEAALREAHEEVGIEPYDVEILGRLTPVSVWVSQHLLQPVVGVTMQRPNFRLAEHEVERLIEIPLVDLQRPGAVAWERRERLRPPYGVMDVPYFSIDGARVWGATAMVLSEFLALIEGAGPA